MIMKHFGITIFFTVLLIALVVLTQYWFSIDEPAAYLLLRMDFGMGLIVLFALAYEHTERKQNLTKK